MRVRGAHEDVEVDLVHAAVLDEQEVHAMLEAEGELLAGCDHDNLVRVRERLGIDGSPVLVLEYVRGKTLREKIRSLEGIHLNWFLAVVRALSAIIERTSPSTFACAVVGGDVAEVETQEAGAAPGGPSAPGGAPALRLEPPAFS